MSNHNGIHIHINGIVQGVGFRPFIYGLASRFNLAGWVRNTSAGVDIDVEGDAQSLNAFIESIREQAPPLAHIDNITVESRLPSGVKEFKIVHSETLSDAFQPISPDVSICVDCLQELFDPNDRRYLYPFINCTNCGPRFTIIKDIPYDRPKTTMAGFELCADCFNEYTDPLDRRFHAQPVACPICGPKVWLEYEGKVMGIASSGKSNQKKSKKPNGKNFNSVSSIRSVQKMLVQGKIVAIKGLGGFHIACDALNPVAVTELRQRKLRVDKPFALMMPDLATIELHCHINEDEKSLLESNERPIVILRRRPDSNIVTQVSPGQKNVGVMLPYTPLHYLLFARFGDQNLINSKYDPPSALVMTSGNLKEEPIAITNSEARERLILLADAFLMHDRPIGMRCDDSVTRILNPTTKEVHAVKKNRNFPSHFSIRRSRGYAPFPVNLPFQSPPILATGAELKNTFCITRDQYAFLSQHIGDMENYETLKSFEEAIIHFEKLFRIHPEVIAYDLHPNYLASRYAQERIKKEEIPGIGVQHHHAHIAACMADNDLNGEEPVIGVSFDGIGYGEDGAIWGGEFLLTDYDDYQRPYHIMYTPLPGGDQAIKEPWRMALAWLYQAGIEWTDMLPPVIYAKSKSDTSTNYIDLLQRQIQTSTNAPLTSSVGRLFDAVASLAGIKQVINYEGQAAIELETISDPSEKSSYPFEIKSNPLEQNSSDVFPKIIDPTPMFRSITVDIANKIPTSIIAAKFHNTLANVVIQTCQLLRSISDIDTVVLSGGVWQNITLLNNTERNLRKENFKVFIHHKVPTNDGGLALGQAIIAGKIFSS
jgi:hydrogenase maturation protein HypF